jgi:type II secretory pathway pseudopilin PulG
MIGDRIKKDKRGLYLLEILLAMGLFAFVVIIATSIFQLAMASQRAVISAQNTQETMRFAMELMSKEMRNSLRYPDGLGGVIEDYCLVSPYFKVYNIEDVSSNDRGSSLIFINKYSECVEYSLENSGGINRLKIRRYDPTDYDPDLSFYISPDEINISQLEFLINDEHINQFHSRQPSVTILITAEGLSKKGSSITMQTTVSSRYYE